MIVSNFTSKCKELLLQLLRRVRRRGILQRAGDCQLRLGRVDSFLAGGHLIL